MERDDVITEVKMIRRKGPRWSEGAFLEYLDYFKSVTAVEEYWPVYAIKMAAKGLE